MNPLPWLKSLPCSGCPRVLMTVWNDHERRVCICGEVVQGGAAPLDVLAEFPRNDKGAA